MISFTDIIWPVIAIGALGLLLGLGLAFAGKKLAVPVDERVEQARDLLAGANCGACGFPGCDGLASALVSGEAPLSACPVTSTENKAKIGEILGMSADGGEPMVAIVRCVGGAHCKTRFRYEGLQDCRAAMLVASGDKACPYGCLGLGTCVHTCKFDALSFGPEGIPEVDREKCTACGQCAKACPRNIIQLVPKSQTAVPECVSHDVGKLVRAACDHGCIACKICEKTCKFDAIKVENNVAVIDYNKCTNCLQCVEKCPRGLIKGDVSARLLASIDPQKCVGCTMCKRNCLFDAISGETKSAHSVDPEKCVGCGQCANKCPKKAISLVNR